MFFSLGSVVQFLGLAGALFLASVIFDLEPFIASADKTRRYSFEAFAIHLDMFQVHGYQDSPT